MPSMPPAAPVRASPAPAPAPAPATPAPAPVAPARSEPAGRVGLDGASTTPAPAGAPAPAGTARAVPAGAPDAGARVGFDVATPPSLPASAPRLNLELVRPRGGELSRGAATGVLRVLPRPPEPAAKSKLAEGLEKAQKPDCRQAYSAMGLAAAAPLARDAVTGDGCRW